MDTLQVIAEPHRRQILALVWDRELAAGDIAQRFDLTFGAVSQHLAVLRAAGLVKVRRDGNKRWYRADWDRLEPYRKILETMWSMTLDQLAAVIEADERSRT
jgi:DNA-binding transcriptional ArsR family regulator